MDLLVRCEGREHEERPGSPRGAFARCHLVRLTPRCGRARSDERVSRAERSPDGRSPPVSTDGGEGIPPFVARRLPPPGRERALPSSTALVGAPGESEPGPTQPPRSSEPVKPKRGHPRSVPHRCVDRPAKLVPSQRTEAPWCVRAVSRVRGLGGSAKPEEAVDVRRLEFLAELPQVTTDPACEPPGPGSAASTADPDVAGAAPWAPASRDRLRRPGDGLGSG